MASPLVFKLNDGTEVLTDFLPPYSVAEQIAWEEEFKASFLAVEQASGVMAKAAQDALEAGESDVDPAKAFKITWILWFGWRRARPNVAARFSTFKDTLASWEFRQPPEDIAAAEPEPPAEVGLDPTVTADLSAPTA